MELTAEGIKRAARDYNSAYPEAAAEINAGRPVILVIAGYSTHYQEITGTITPGVQVHDGWIGAAEPEPFRFAPRDGRLTATENARRIFGRRYVAVPVPVVYEKT